LSRRGHGIAGVAGDGYSGRVAHYCRNSRELLSLCEAKGLLGGRIFNAPDAAP
jgi:hypothetical protein